MSRPPDDQTTQLARRLGLFDATMIVMGGIIGSGIFINPYVVAQRVHTQFLILGVWVFGGLLALIENPDQRERLRANPDLMGTAVEEMIRWTTPVKEFMRTATADTEVRGVRIAEGESVYLAYVSGNRDEEVFDDPFRFDIARDPNKHVAFGYGVHFCLGAALARMEMNSLFSELIPRLESIELAGTPELSATTFVGGLKHLPIRYSVR